VSVAKFYLKGCASRIDVSKDKLALVLDLDHTLVHAVCARFIAQEYDVNSRDFKDMVERARISTSTRLLIHGSKCAVRPEMLEDLKSTFTMYIYTMGTKAYAEEVKKILDPCGVIFGKRVLSRCDTPTSASNSYQNSSWRTLTLS
jgi:TFIIF-interacting CTD phosphatase-like protein